MSGSAGRVRSWQLRCPSAELRSCCRLLPCAQGNTSIVPLPAPFPFAWLESIVRLGVNSLLPEVGLDAVIYVGFTRCCLLILLLTAPFDLSVVLWANEDGGNSLNPQTYSDLDVISMGNLRAGSPKLWAHLVSVVLKTVVVLKVVDNVRDEILISCLHEPPRRRA